MDLIITKDELVRLTAAALPVIERRNTIPILQMLKITAIARVGSLSFSATDLDCFLKVRGEANILSDGALCVDALVLANLAKKLPAKGEIHLKTSESGELIVTAGKARFALFKLPTDDFPSFTGPDETEAISFEMQGSALKALLRPVRGAVSNDASRHYLSGPFIHVHKNKLRAVATDGHRLVLKEIDLPAGADAMPGIILPGAKAKMIENMLPDDTISVTIDKHKISLASTDVNFISKVVEGTFPDYERVIPKEFSGQFSINSERLVKAVDRVTSVATEKSKAIRLTFNKDNLLLYHRSDFQDEAEEDFGVTPLRGTVTDETIVVGFNAKYVSEMLSVIGATEIEISVGADTSPSRFTNPDDNSLIGVVMPMRA